VAVDAGECKGQLGDLCCSLNEPVEVVEGIIGPFLQFGRWESSVGRDNEFSLDARQRFWNDCRWCRFLLFVCDGGKRFLTVSSCCGNAHSPGGIVGGWFMRAWGGWCVCALSGGTHRGPSPLGVVAGWFVGGWGSILLLAHMVEFSGDGGHLFL
jgi:hypothetical protein